tara:strand:- start:207 stop:434 length:228 start_codon:yes stop_codon:yes gene_type:complete
MVGRPSFSDSELITGRFVALQAASVTVLFFGSIPCSNPALLIFVVTTGNCSAHAAGALKDLTSIPVQFLQNGKTH